MSLRPALTVLTLGMAGLAALASPALAQSTPATIFCANDKILVERSTMQQVQSRFGHGRVCIIGPSFDFQPDGVTWVRNTLRKNVGDSCSCG
jgi:hypothetical protein